MRYAFSERLMHFCAAVSYVYLLLSGLAFWSPSFYWIATVLGGGFLVRAMHPWVGVVFAVVIIGGLANPPGALLAGLLIGVSESLTMAVVTPAWAPLVSFSVLIFILIARPGRV